MSLDNRNPTKEEYSAYIKREAEFFHLPLPLVLATIHIESDFLQFDENGCPLADKTCSDFGIMQINRRHKESESDWGTIPDRYWNHILYDWKYNLNFGLQELTACYLLANRNHEDLLGEEHFHRSSKEEFLARASYSAYNAGPAHIGRYRTTREVSIPRTTPEGYDDRDITFYEFWCMYQA